MRERNMRYETLIDLERCTAHPRVFFDPEVYTVEQEPVFGRQWLYIGHESQLPEPGDFLTTTMGPPPMVKWMDTVRREAWRQCMAKPT